MSEILKPDICVIGAGSGGLSVAAAAAAFGVEVVLIEKGKMGGDCLNYGCVPSKAVISAAKQAQGIRDAGKFGIVVGDPQADYKRLHDHVHEVIAEIEPHDSEERFTGLGVKVVRAPARFIDPETVVAGDIVVKARRFVVATGSSPFVPPIKGMETTPFFTNETIFDNADPIDHLIIVGGGPIGIEMAQAHRRLGAKVTVLEGLEILAKDDPELVAIVKKRLQAENMDLRENAFVKSVTSKKKGSISVDFEINGSSETVTGSHLLVATGRAPNVDELGLQEAGIEYDRKGVKVTENLRTTNGKVYAIGDVTGGLQFTHVAGYHAGLVIRSILFRMRATPRNHIVPWVTYTDPELGNVGMSEQSVREKFGDSIQVLRWAYSDNDRAQAERKTEGMIKLVANRRGRILGAGIVGANAGEMLNMWALVIANGMKLSQIASYVSPYPTMTEIGKRAAVSSFSPMAKNRLIRWIIGILSKFG